MTIKCGIKKKLRKEEETLGHSSMSSHQAMQPPVHRGKKMELNEDDDEAPKSLLEERLSNYREPIRQPFIYKVPNHYLRDANDKAHEPKMVAIGPYHHGKQSLKMMEQHKLLYLKSLLQRRNKKVGRYLSAVAEIEEEARSCYAEDLSHLSSDEFTQMLVLDGCFIIELLRRYRLNPDPSDPVFQIMGAHAVLMQDLILFENQIPLLVICKLFDGDDDWDFVCTLLGLVKLRRSEVKHLLHLFHAMLRPSFDFKIDPTEFLNWLIEYIIDPSRCPSATELTENIIDLSPCPSATDTEAIATELKENMAIATATELKENIAHQLIIPSATELKDANVTFSVISERGILDLYINPSNRFKIEFDKNGVLRLPPLCIEDGTDSLFRNLILYEQFFPDDRGNNVMDYVHLMDCLINTAQDVEILSRCGIVGNFIGDNQVAADIINRLTYSAFLSPKNFIYADAFDRINAHYNRRWNRARAALNRDYFNTPWAYISFFAALLLLSLTLLQTVFSAPS